MKDLYYRQQKFIWKLPTEKWLSEWIENLTFLKNGIHTILSIFLGDENTTRLFQQILKETPSIGPKHFLAALYTLIAAERKSCHPFFCRRESSDSAWLIPFSLIFKATREGLYKKIQKYIKLASDREHIINFILSLS